MQNEYLQRMIDYHYWAQNKLWECVLPLSDEQMEFDPHYSRGSIHAQLVHMYIVEWMWYRCCIHDVPKTREGLNPLICRRAINYGQPGLRSNRCCVSSWQQRRMNNSAATSFNR
ncbi:MAG: hypothetical protein GC204_16055 [Chloroflexi bacterium]|nr:hypothetical protein [Chloroflexota bacterium]